MLSYTFASPFHQSELSNSTVISTYAKNYCQYNYSKLLLIGKVRSITYFCLLIPAIVLIGFVLKYFYLLRGTNQIRSVQQLWTIRATSLLCIIVFYDVYLFYLEHIAETYQSFFVASRHYLFNAAVQYT